MTQSDLFTGSYLRDEGARLALGNAGESWNDRAVEISLAYFKTVGYNGCLFEEIRTYAEGIGFPSPPSPNAWGAVCLTLSKRGMIVKTGEYLQSKATKSHSRAQPVWRIK